MVGVWLFLRRHLVTSDSPLAKLIAAGTKNQNHQVDEPDPNFAISKAMTEKPMAVMKARTALSMLGSRHLRRDEK